MSTTRACRFNGLVGLGVAAAVCALPAPALAFYSGSADERAGALSAGSLAFALDTHTLSGDIAPEAPAEASFATTNAGSIAPRYRLTAAQGACPDAFYDGLDITLAVGATMASSTLAALAATTETAGAWHLSISAPRAAALAGDTCSIELQLEAWQPQFASASAGGFSQRESITLTLTATESFGESVVVNEPLPTPALRAIAPTATTSAITSATTTPPAASTTPPTLAPEAPPPPSVAPSASSTPQVSAPPAPPSAPPEESVASPPHGDPPPASADAAPAPPAPPDTSAAPAPSPDPPPEAAAP